MARPTVGAGPGAPPVAARGYCAHCHEVTAALDGCCSVCGGGLIDVTVEGTPPPTATPPAPPSIRVVPSPAVPKHGAQAPPRGRSKGVRIVWAFAVALLLIGVFFFVVANHDDTSNHKTFATDYKALGSRDATTVGAGLDYRVRKVDTAFNTYVAAAAAVRALHQTITGKFNDIVTATDALLLTEPTKARAQLPGLIAKYGAAVKREGAARVAYLRQLALLKAQVAR